MATIVKRRVKSSNRQALLRVRSANREIKDLVSATGDTIKAAFEDIVSDWSPENQTQFVKRLSVKPDEIRVEVRPKKRAKASEVFGYVDKGTRPHEIRPKKAGGRLAFRAGPYSPKTLPVAQAHAGTGQASGPLVFPAKVDHPGTEARLFSEDIEAWVTPHFRSSVENLFRRLERKLRSG